MSDAEVDAFLAQERTLICATTGRDGRPHLMPLWFVVRPGGEIWSWTYSKSQKVRNLERDARATLQVEAGETYDQLRGVMIHADVEIHRDLTTVAALGRELMARYAAGDGAAPTAEATAAIDAQARKRVALRFLVRRTASWDHRKLASLP